MKIYEAIERYVSYIANERRMASGTVVNYQHDLMDLAKFVERYDITDTDELTAREVREWQMEHLGGGDKPGTVKRRLAAVGGWLRWMRRRGYLDRDIMAKVKAPKQPKRTPVFFRESETERLYDEGIFGNDFKGRRDALMLRMLYETGVRRSELAGLKESSVDLQQLTIKVLGKGNKERVIPIESELAHNISEYMALKRAEREGEDACSEWLFENTKGGQISATQIYRIVHKYMSMLSTADRTSPHVFRHSFATHILSEGGDMEAIRQLLGHASLTTTEIYTHVTKEHLKDVYRNAHPRGKKS